MATKDDFSTLDEKVGKLDQKFNSLERGPKNILDILDKNNQFLKKLRRLPERVEHLERFVFRR